MRHAPLPSWVNTAVNTGLGISLVLTPAMAVLEYVRVLGQSYDSTRVVLLVALTPAMAVLECVRVLGQSLDSTRVVLGRYY